MRQDRFCLVQARFGAVWQMKMRLPCYIIVALWMVASMCDVRAASDAVCPRPEHPRPDFERSEWANLNGTWEFAETDDDHLDAQFLGPNAVFPDRIVVPFCRESRLSGLARRGFVRNVWYRRTFTLPAGWKSPRVRLHIGGCDWKTRAWLNGRALGEHTGGAAAFAFDATDALQPGTTNTLILHAFDDVRSGLQAGGKQSDKEESYGCLYTRVTGLWQTVWLEGVGTAWLRNVAIEPDVAAGCFWIRAAVEGLDTKSQANSDTKSDILLNVVAKAGHGKPDAPIAGTASARAANRCVNLRLDLAPPARLWSPEDPFLYDLIFTLRSGGETLDEVRSYAGLREVRIEGNAILLNGRRVFQRLVLDQGYYPDGVWTAPSDEALRRDIELAQAAGFNGARLHQKVFEPRFLYWADRMGYLVWGEYPNWGLRYGDPAIRLPVLREWTEVIERDRNHPAIVGWCPFNETAAEAADLQQAALDLTRTLDPSRPALETSGWSHTAPAPDLLDAHDYNQDPAALRARWAGDEAALQFTLPKPYGLAAAGKPFLVSEYGGIGWDVAGGWGYGSAPKTPEEFRERFCGLTSALMDSPFLCGVCYTQLCDVEQERNGLYTYDRKPKFDLGFAREAFARSAAIEGSQNRSANSKAAADAACRATAWRFLIAPQPEGAASREWAFTTADPGPDWARSEFDDSAWARGFAGFGRKDGWENRTRTPWTTSNLWLRQRFTFQGTSADAASAILVIHHDDDCAIYLNSRLVWQRAGWNDAYGTFRLGPEFTEALRQGENLLAVSVRQGQGGQFFDLGLMIPSPRPPHN